MKPKSGIPTREEWAALLEWSKSMNPDHPVAAKDYKPEPPVAEGADVPKDSE